METVFQITGFNATTAEYFPHNDYGVRATGLKEGFHVVRARAFLTDGARCVLPAFGAYAGGLNACDPAFVPLFPAGFTAHVIGRSRVFSLSHASLCGD